MNTIAVCFLSFVVCYLIAYIASRRDEARKVDRWAATLGTERHPGESTGQLAERLSARTYVRIGGRR